MYRESQSGSPRTTRTCPCSKDALHAAGCGRIFEDCISGARPKRPGLAAALGFVREGDVLVVWRLDRLGRSLPDLIETVGRLEARGIGLHSIHESIDTSSSTGRLVFHVFAALAEFERSLIRERTRAGLKAARARGRVGGRPKALDADRRKLAVRLYEEKQHTVRQICGMTDISRPTLYKYVAAARS